MELPFSPLWSIEYRSEYHMTNDSDKFVDMDDPRFSNVSVNSKGSIAVNGKEYLSLVEGRMIGNHTPSNSGWVKGRGRTAKWRAIDQNQITFEPQFLIEKITHRELYPEDSAKLAFVDVTSAINSRTCVASVIPALPCGGSAPRYIAKNGAVELFYLSGWVNSLPVDLIFRLFVNGLHLKPYHMEDIYASTDIIIIQSIAKLAQSIHGFPESVSDVIHTTSKFSAAPSYFLANHAFHRKRVLSMIDALVSHSMAYR